MPDGRRNGGDPVRKAGDEITGLVAAREIPQGDEMVVPVRGHDDGAAVNVGHGDHHPVVGHQAAQRTAQQPLAVEVPPQDRHVLPAGDGDGTTTVDLSDRDCPDRVPVADERLAGPVPGR